MKLILSLFLILSLQYNINCSLNDRLDCWLENDFSVDKVSCEQRGCIWDGEKRPNGVPICYLDRNRVGYRRVGDIRNTTTGLQLDLSLKDSARSVLTKSPQVESVRVEWTYLTDRIVRVKLVDPTTKRYEVPIQQNFPLLVDKQLSVVDPQKLQYSVDIGQDLDDFSFSIQRKSTKTKIFDTSIGGLIFSDQLLQIATRLPTANVYGMGENTHHSLRHDFNNYKTFPLFTQDRGTGDEQFNYYGVHPFYTCLESDGQSHGILYLSSNAMEYTLLPEPGLSFKTLGGVLDMFVFVGDNPEHVIELYTSLIGRPILPPFWGLGFQLTRWGYKGTDDVRGVIDRNLKANVPLDVMYMDIDYMDQYHDFSYNKQAFGQLPQLINDTKTNSNLHWTLILDPAIEAVDKDNQVFMDGYSRDVYVKWDKSIAKKDRYNPPNVPSDRDVLYGKVWPRGPVAFPDFFKNVTQDWWLRWVVKLHNDLKFDALWIDMNEPSNLIDDKVYHCPQNKYDYPAIRTKVLYGNNIRDLGHKTICMTTRQGDNNGHLHYDVHSLYGLTETMATQKAIHAATGKRGFAVSRSTYVSSGRYGTHWLGDNTSEWPHMKYSIIGILEFNMFGINFVGPDICGFGGNTTPELCKRWHQLGAFYPFSRNHNCIGSRDQDPASWITAGHPEVTEAMKVSFGLRYKLLPYFYTLFYRAHTRGQTVARPVFHEFPTDNNTYSIDEQFMFGPAVLVSPFLYEGQKQVKAYLPDNTVWYDLNLNRSKSGYIAIDDYGIIPVHFRGGYVLPISSDYPHVNTRTVREGGINLLVLPDQSGRAVGDFFWDDGDSIDTIEKSVYNYYTFSVANNSLDLQIEKLNYKTKQLLKSIEILSSNEGQTWTVTLDDKPLPSVKVNRGLANIAVNIDLFGKSVGQKWTLKWKPV